MALIIRTIGPGGGPTYDYATLSAWEAAEQTDLVTAGDIHEAQCYTFAGGLDDRVEIAGWTTGVSNYIVIRAAPGHIHTGVPKTGFYIEQNAGFVYLIDIGQAYTRLYDLDFDNPSANGGGIECAQQQIWIERCFSKAGSARGAFWMESNTYAYNCCAYESPIGYTAGNFRDWYARGCNAIKCPTGFQAGGANGMPELRSCVAYLCDNDVIDNGQAWSATSDYNATSKATDAEWPNAGSGNNVVNLVDADFVDHPNNDWHVSGVSSALYEAAPDMSLFYIDDIDRETRVLPFDIGFDEFLGAIGPIEIDIQDLIHVRPVDIVDVVPLAIGLTIDGLTHGRPVDEIAALGVSVDLFLGSLTHVRPVDSLLITPTEEVAADDLRHIRIVDVVDVQELVGVLIDISSPRHGRPVDSLLLDVDQPILVNGLAHGRPVDTVDVQPLLGDQTGMGATAAAWVLDAGQALTNAASLDFSYHVLEGVFDSANSVLGIDGSRVSGSAGMRELTALTFGADVDGNRRMEGEIAELRIYDGALTAAQRDAIIAELQTKWITG